MEFKRGRYSWLMRPFFIVFDLTIINILAFYFFSFNDRKMYFFSSTFLNNKHLLFIVYTVILWLASSFFLKFYKVYRYTSLLKILSLLVKQYIAYTIIVYAFIGIFRSVEVQAFVTLKYISYSFAIIGFLKIANYYILKKFRFYLQKNIRRVVIIGNNDGAKELRKLFTNKKELGYQIQAVFSDRKNGNNLDGNIQDSMDYLENTKGIDEIYCAIDELEEEQINEYVKHASLKLMNVKFIPNTKKIYSKRLKADYYNYTPILSIQEVALNNDINKFIKRVFDIVFSLFVIVFILSWLTVLLYILIKLESRGPLFYKHRRNGINYEEFSCYKFRSLRVNTEGQKKYVGQDDERVTKIGKFLRKTSLDELPQFFNVLKGDMSVVGPRPHMLSYTHEYSKKIDKYNFIFRHSVKPGLTGLAQVKGYRGEVINDEDIINRIKYDIFYIENWSIILDFKIILDTIVNILKGEKKAY